MTYGILEIFNFLKEVRKVDVIICYDVSDNKLRYRLVKYLEKIAVRVQFSVFKANINKQEILRLNNFAKKLLKNGKEGNMLIYEVVNELSGNERVYLPEQYVFI